MRLPELTDDDIKYAERVTGLSFSDPARRELLLCRDSIDIWACPGSGKTSLLVAKLAVLGRRWKPRHQGVCVLSHTNVAREEIEQTLARTESRALLSSPHFIGTIQLFVDQFLGVPGALERFGVRPWSVDTDKCEAAFERELQQPRYSTLRAFLTRKDAKKRKGLIRDLSFSTSDGSVALDPEALNAGPASVSFEQMVQLKETLATRGIVSYKDMYTLGYWYLSRHAMIREALAHRFPWVFIDEMQDTSAHQWSLLSQIFQPPCVVQRLGDNHQEIFEDPDEEGVQFPGPVKATIQDSHRLSPSIAAFVGKLTPGGGQTLNGNPRRDDLRHGIVLFNSDTVGQVLPFFAQHVVDQVLPIKPDASACAVGAVAKEPDAGKFPHSLVDYWADFVPPAARFVPPADSIAEHVQDALLTVRATGNFGILVDTVMKQLSDVLRAEGVVRTDGKRHTPQTLLRTLRTDHPERFRRLTKGLTAMCTAAWSDPHCRIERMWEAYECALAAVAPDLSEKGKRLLREPARADRTAAIHVAQQALNTYRHTSSKSTLDIRLSTIHGIKGKSLDATLVLETLHIKHDLSRVLRLALEGEPRRPSAHLMKQARRVYVGVSRPRYLLFLAVSREQVKTSTLEKMLELGWDVHDLLADAAPAPEATVALL